MPQDATSPLPTAVASPADGPEVLRREILEAVETGDFPRALGLLDQALAEARAVGEPDEVDRATCERAAIAVELGKAEDDVSALRQILVRSANDLNCCRAAYTLGRVHELDKAFRKAQFYARLARDRSERSDEASWRARCHNLLGNVLLAESHVEDAVREYELALELIPTTQVVWSAHIWDNLGYCRVLQGRYGAGFSLLLKALRTFRRHHAAPYELESHLDLSFAFLEVDRPAAARRHGEAALLLASELGDMEARKKALYLAGQAALLAGERDAARLRFAQLGDGFYPELAGLEELLLEVDIRQLVNLKA